MALFFSFFSNSTGCVRLTNAEFVHDDKLRLTFNFKDGTRTITCNDVKTAIEKSGSDLDCLAAPRKQRPQWGRCFLMYADERTRTHLNASVRWTLAATSANTGGYHNFAPKEQNANRVRPPAPKKQAPLKGSCFLYCKETELRPYLRRCCNKN